MFDENVCFHCGDPSPGNSLYCSEKCRLQDCGDGSTSNSNSSVAPSSASTSPSRTSPRVHPTKQRDDTAINRHIRHSKRYSTNSSRTSSPSLHTSDLPELSDEDVEIVAANDRKGRNLQDTILHRGMVHNSQKMLDHAFWKSRYAEFTTAKAMTTPNCEDHGSNSLPGKQTGLNYVRKPGPINANASGTSKLAGGFSPFKGSHSHKRLVSEYGYSQYSIGPYTSTANYTEKIPRQGSAESAASSTPRSKSAVALASSVTRLPVTASDSTLSASLSRPSVSASANSAKPVSDSAVHTLRKTALQFTVTDELPAAVSYSLSPSFQSESLALSALKDVARNHGMIDGGSSRPAKPRLLVGDEILSSFNLRRLQNGFKAGTSQSKTSQSSIANSLASKNLRSHDDRQDAHEGRYDPKAEDSESECSDDRERAERGRSRKKRTPSRSPSPPSWASWAEDEPVNPRRGRSARRG